SSPLSSSGNAMPLTRGTASLTPRTAATVSTSVSGKLAPSTAVTLSAARPAIASTASRNDARTAVFISRIATTRPTPSPAASTLSAIRAHPDRTWRYAILSDSAALIACDRSRPALRFPTLIGRACAGSQEITCSQTTHFRAHTQTPIPGEVPRRGWILIEPGSHMSTADPAHEEVLALSYRVCYHGRERWHSVRSGPFPPPPGWRGRSTRQPRETAPPSAPGSPPRPPIASGSKPVDAG